MVTIIDYLDNIEIWAGEISTEAPNITGDRANDNHSIRDTILGNAMAIKREVKRIKECIKIDLPDKP